jgi:DNA-binding MarR family transcriptional regulator
MDSKNCESGDLEWGVLSDMVFPRVRQLRNLLAARSVAALTPTGLPTGSLTILSLIAANPGRSQAALARRAGINKSALVGIVDQLEKAGLAARDRSEVDRRRNTLTVTESGLAAMEAMHEAAKAIEEPLREALGKEDVEILAGLLERSFEALKAVEDEREEAA